MFIRFRSQAEQTVSRVSEKVFTMQFIDIHSHILPYLDDGAFSRDDALEMAKIADENAISEIVCTAHASAGCRYSANELAVTLRHTAERIEKSGCAVRLRPGQEILIRGDAPEVVSALERGSLLTLAGSRYVLIEFKMSSHSGDILNAAETVAAGGFVPVIAHPERYAAFAENPGLAHSLHACGALLQINKGSVTGYFGKTAEIAVKRLLENRQADFLASDAHSPFGRTPEIRSAHEWISEHCSPEYADYLAFSNPSRVLRDETVRPVHRS